MAVVTISDELLERVEQSRPNLSTAEFVADAVREKLAWQERRSEFFRLSDETRMYCVCDAPLDLPDRERWMKLKSIGITFNCTLGEL